MTEEEFEALIEKVARALWWDEYGEFVALPRYESMSAVYIARARAAVASTGLKPGVVVVPAEPTKDMFVNGGLAIEESMFGEHDLIYDSATKCFKAMIAAAARPQPASAGEPT